MSKLRNYNVEWKPPSSPLPSASIKGDFIRIDKITRKPSSSISVQFYDNDYYVVVKFDDEGEILLRAGESVRNRPYQRLTFDLRRADRQGTNNPIIDQIIYFTAGEGELIVRPENAIPNKMRTRRIETAGDGVPHILVGYDEAVKEVRLHIPLGQPSGIWLGSDIDKEIGTDYGFWLEVGAIEYISYCGDLWYNYSGDDILISVSLIFRND